MQVYSNPWADLLLYLALYSFAFWLLWRGFRALFSPTFPAMFETRPAPSRYHILPAADPCDHPFSDLPFTDLVAHLYDSHFEVWNHLAGEGRKEPPPSRWRSEHAADHGTTVGGIR